MASGMCEGVSGVWKGEVVGGMCEGEGDEWGVAVGGEWDV